MRAKFGVSPAQIPDYLALVGDSADGYPGVSGIGPKNATRLIALHGSVEQIPEEIVKDRERALLFKRLAILRRDLPVFSDVEELHWRGATDAFRPWAAKIGDRRLSTRVRDLTEGSS